MARVLVVDDEPAVRWVLSDLLRENGHQVFEASDGQAALVRLRDQEVEVILCDLSMPRMDGFALLRALPEDVRGRTPFVLLTASDDRGTVEEAIHLGAFDHLAKPCGEAELVDTVDRALAARERLLERGRRILPRG
jgi:CheY-like chemotaxis protein